MFRLVAILGKLTTKQFKTHTNKISPYDAIQENVQIMLKLTGRLCVVLNCAQFPGALQISKV
jgi:hypothetical protein